MVRHVPPLYSGRHTEHAIDDTLARKVNTSDASVFADQFGCCPSRVWGFLWLVISFVFFALGVLVGLVAFKVGFPRNALWYID